MPPGAATRIDPQLEIPADFAILPTLTVSSLDIPGPRSTKGP
jgi:hypothetical protein